MMSTKEFKTMKQCPKIPYYDEEDFDDDEDRFKTIPIRDVMMITSEETLYYDPIYTTLQQLPLTSSSSSSKNDTQANSFNHITDTHSSCPGSKDPQSICDAFEIMSMQIQRSFLGESDMQEDGGGGCGCEISNCLQGINNNSSINSKFDQVVEEEPVSMRQLARVQTTREGGEISIPIVRKDTPYKKNIQMAVDVQAEVKYADKSFLGEGSFGRVFSGVWQGKKVAVKIFKEEYQTCLGTECTRIFESEFDIMAKIHHENIVECFGGNKDLSKRAIIMEFMDKGSLDSFIHRNTHSIKLVNFYKIIKSICKALAYLHPTIVHRDIKPQNVLLNRQGLVKVADFGLSRFKEATTLFSSNAAGTPHYVAPEVLTGKYKTGPQVDIYSVAILMWELYTRQRPWQGVKDYQIAYLVMTDQRPEIPADCPQQLKKMIKKCWAPNPQNRPTSQDLYLWCKEQIEIENQRPEPILLHKTPSQ